MGNKSSPRGTRARMTTEAFSEAGIAGVGSTGLTTQEPDDGRGVVPTLMSVLALIGALFLGQLAIGEVGYRATPCQLSPPAAATCALTCTLTFVWSGPWHAQGLAVRGGIAERGPHTALSAHRQPGKGPGTWVEEVTTALFVARPGSPVVWWSDPRRP